MIIVLIISTCLSCSNNQDPNYITHPETDYKKWETLLSSLGDGQFRSKKTILLITYLNYCSSCINELKNWALIDKKNDEVEVILVLTEKYNSRADAYLSTNNLDFKALIDSTFIIHEAKMIPYLPIKILFENGEITTFGEIGSGTSYSRFIQLIK